jgi:hypothetical protein
VAALASSSSGHGRLQNNTAHGGVRTAQTPSPSRDAKKTPREENPSEEDSCAPGGKKTQPKKTTSSNRPNHYTFRTAMTIHKESHYFLRDGTFVEHVDVAAFQFEPQFLRDEVFHETLVGEGVVA